MKQITEINRRLLSVLIMAYVIALSLYGYWNYNNTQKNIMAGIDKELYNSAKTLKFVLPDKFHDRATDPRSLSVEDDKAIAAKLTRLVKETGFKYAYTIVKQNGMLFFVASDITADPGTSRGTFYFYKYEDADESFYKAFDQNEPIYKTVSDQWGTVRTVMIPEESEGGVKYLACVDYDISHVNEMLYKNLVKSILTVLFFLLLAVPILIIYLRLHRKYWESLQESERKMKSIFQAAPVGIGVVVDRVFQEVNDRFCEMTGFSRDELIGQSARMIYPNDDEYDRVGTLKYKRIKDKGTGEVDTCFQRKDGNIINVLLRSTPIEPERLSLGVTFTAMDITDRKKAEESLKESHERFLTVLDGIDATVYVADMETHEILFMNKTMINTFGRDMTGEPCYKVFRGEKAPCSYCTNNQLLDSKKNSTGVIVWHDKNPITERWYINHDRAIKWPDGRMVRLQIATDITEMKDLEYRLQRAQKMEAIGSLAGGIAHDFNNILFPIVGIAEMLMEDLPPDSHGYKDAEQILRAGKRGSDLVKQILAFSRQAEQKKIPIRIQQVLKEVLKLSRSTIPANIQISQDIQSNCGTVLADPTKIHQVAMNLITNAFHAVEPINGEITVKLRETTLGRDEFSHDDLAPGKYALLTITDTGIGIDPAIIHKIFDPYFTTKKPGKGTGLGLSVVYGIIRDHHGDITVYSEKGEGTTFNVYLPIIETAEKYQPMEEKTQSSGGNERILLVDDEESIVTMEKQLLERLGYRVTERVSSVDASKAFEANPTAFDLVISDMTMPNMTGDVLAKEMMKIRPDIPIIICTGFSERINQKRAEALGIKGFLLKPVLASEMARIVRKVLDEAKSENQKCKHQVKTDSVI